MCHARCGRECHRTRCTHAVATEELWFQPRRPKHWKNLPSGVLTAQMQHVNLHGREHGWCSEDVRDNVESKIALIGLAIALKYVHAVL